VIVRLDAAGRVVSANAATLRLLGRPPAELVGRPLADHAEPGRRDRVAAAVAGVAGGRVTAAQVEFELAAPAAGVADLRLRGMTEGAIGNLHDVTDAVALRRSLERMARYDEMTGLANRAYVAEVVGAWLAGLGGPVAVVSGDLNGFKAVNDRFGHPAGDDVLREIADRLRELVRPLPADCLVGRIGGDEFVVAVRDLDDAGVTALALRLGAATTPSFRVGERTLRLAISVGVATARPGDGVDASTLLHRASLAMSDAKAEGLTEVTRWAPHLEERAQRRVDIAIGLRAALDQMAGQSTNQSTGQSTGQPTGQSTGHSTDPVAERNGLILAYQPLVRLADGAVIGAEALIRVPPQGPDGPFAGLAGLVTPGEIVEVAEDTGVIMELGHWVLTEATRQAAQWRLDGHDVLIGVNMSVRQLAASGFADTVLAAMEAAGLPPDRLFLEITESRLLGESGPALFALERLKAAGVVIAIDDFGTGDSSLSYLRRLPVRAVKLDRALLEGILDEPRARGLVRAVTSMADVLGLMVVAEGLEDLDTIRTVHHLGATIGQGYALSPAVPAAWMARILRHGRLDTGLAGECTSNSANDPPQPDAAEPRTNGANGHVLGPAVELPDPRPGRVSHAETRGGPD
jgi:diguanylate cyclase (GGDEF)-like protein